MAKRKRLDDKSRMRIAIERVERTLGDGNAVLVIAAPFQGVAETDQNKPSYIANCEREDAVKILKHLLFGWGHGEEWMKQL